jgi:hypothetical protein
MLTDTPNVCLCDGSQATAYFDSSDDCTTPIWNEHLDVKGDLNMGNEKQKNENTPRGKASGCFRTYSAGKSDLTIDFEVGCSWGYIGNDMIKQMDSCIGGRPKQWAFLTRCILDDQAVGYAGCFQNFSESNNNPLDGNATTSISFAPSAICEECQCGVRPVKVGTPGTIEDIVAAANVQAIRAVSNDLMQVRLDRLVLMRAALDNHHTGKVINIAVDDILAVGAWMGKALSNFQSDFAVVSSMDNAVIAPLSDGKVTRGYTEVKRDPFKALLDEYVGSVRNKINAAKVVVAAAAPTVPAKQ